jgi:hypothetical protein
VPHDKLKNTSVHDRVKACADWVNSLDEPCLIWAETNEESELLTNAINNAVEVKGSQKPEVIIDIIKRYCCWLQNC